MTALTAFVLALASLYKGLAALIREPRPAPPKPPAPRKAQVRTRNAPEDRGPSREG
jgi:hypothetical protein